ncbi:hypothetical protein [Fischerella thermalis]
MARLYITSPTPPNPLHEPVSSPSPILFAPVVLIEEMYIVARV